MVAVVVVIVEVVVLLFVSGCFCRLVLVDMCDEYDDVRKSNGLFSSFCSFKSFISLLLLLPPLLLLLLGWLLLLVVVLFVGGGGSVLLVI
jgi:hypothetical protein